MLYQSTLKTVVVTVLAALVAACGGGGTTADTTTPTTTTVTLTGQIAIDSADASLAAPLARSLMKAGAKSVGFFTKADTPAASFDVTLVKVNGDGTEETVSGVTATTDTAGNYTLDAVPVVTTGNGVDTDFYYEVRATSGTLELRSPVAPEGDATADVSPETTLAARMLTDVASIPGDTTPPPPSADLINNLRELVAADVSDLADKAPLPTSVATSEEENHIVAASALATDGANSEGMLRTFEAEAEALKYKADGTDADVDQVSAYLERITRSGCNFSSSFTLPQIASDALAEAFIAETTFTPSAIVDAVNANSSSPDVAAATAVTDYKATLTNVETAIANDAQIASGDLGGLLAKRDLVAADFATTTALDADQSLAFMQGLFASNCDPSNADLTSVVADLTENTDLDAAAISDVQIYHDSTGACPGQGHFRADVAVYIPGGGLNDISSVTITGSNIGTVTLSSQGNRFIRNNENGDCVTFNQEITYTVTANLTSGGPLTQEVTRNHPQVPEATQTIDDVAVSRNQNSPSVTTDVRPVFTWTSPTEALADTTGAPDGSAIKYTYEFSYIDKTDNPVSPLSQCGSVSSGKLYATDHFMPTIDCDIEACAASTGTSVADVTCRMNIQTYLVDERDRLLGQAAGSFTFFCVDLDNDGDCG